MTDREPCKKWTWVSTRVSNALDTYVSTEDMLTTPDAALSVLGAEIDRIATNAWQESKRMVSDADAVWGFPKTTVEVNVCLRPVRVLLMPASDWAPASPMVH